MTEPQPDYRKYSLDDLLDVQTRIDREQYPERARAVDDEIAKRERAAVREPAPVRLAEPVSVKPGRAPSLKRALGSLGAAVFGVGWLAAARAQNNTWYMTLIGLTFIAIALVDFGYQLYNATQRRRFSEFDVKASDDEPDPLAAILERNASGPSETRGPRRRYPGGHCPFCGAGVPDDADCCPSCGKDV